MSESTICSEEFNKFDVVVVGSCMIDLTCYTPRLPKSGETICGQNFTMGFGGKGCNQCVAAKKLGANSALIASNKLLEYGIKTNYVKMISGVSSGMAQITVAATGENHIVIVLGANEKLTENDVNEAREIIINSKVLICQMEIPESSTIKALQIKAESKKGLSILNAAPASLNFNPLLFALPDIFCVNEIEAEILTGIEVTDIKTAEKALSELLLKGCKIVIITLGEKGAVYGKKENTNFTFFPAVKVKAIDTTGAGDAFIGALAFYLSTQPEFKIEEVIKRASKIAAISVQKPGTQDSFPEFTELPQF